MKDRQKLVQAFAELHRPGEPLILYNAWDAGSARAVVEAGAPAVATGSWSVAAAQGYGDAEELPLELALANAERIVVSVSVPVTIDFEGGYAVGPDEVAENAGRLAATDAIGCNFEDRVVHGDGLYSITEQAEGISAIREGVGPAFFINARTDLFLKAPAAEHADCLSEAVERARAYEETGASGFFAPGLVDRDLIARLCEGSRLPVNIMAFPGVPEADVLATLGVARVSHGPGPYRRAMARLTEEARVFYG